MTHDLVIRNGTVATATEDDDYQGKSGNISFADNDTTPQPISIDVNGDLLVESDENFTVGFDFIFADKQQGQTEADDWERDF